jgi:hypothetical protein
VLQWFESTSSPIFFFCFYYESFKLGSIFRNGFNPLLKRLFRFFFFYALFCSTINQLEVRNPMMPILTPAFFLLSHQRSTPSSFCWVLSCMSQLFLSNKKRGRKVVGLFLSSEDIESSECYHCNNYNCQDCN